VARRLAAAARRWLSITGRIRRKQKKNLAEIKSAGGQATATHADMSKEREIKTMFARISREFGAIHILVNNAGIENKSPFLKMPVQDWDHVMAVNLRGVFPCSQLAARR
jgi:NAD(P)-dependent dehydrogenase (short-subunit alcohol dehydrogenase family)